MHRGCFVWTMTPPLSGRRTPRPGPARVCVCVPCLAGWGGPASRERFDAPHLSFCRSWFALCLFSPLRAGVAPFVVVVGFCSFSPSPPLLRPRCVLLCVFSGPACLGPWRLVPPPPFFFPPPPLCAPLSPALRVFRPGGPRALASCCPPPSCRLWCSCLVWSSLGVFPVVSCSPVLCPVALCCRVVLCCGTLSSFLFFPLLLALVSCCSRLILRSRPVPSRFSFCALPVRCCTGVPASLVPVRCSLALAGLAGVLCCCLLCLCLCCWAWLSSVVSWWVLVDPGVVSRWRAVVCPWVLCCAVLLRVVRPGVALLCAVLFYFALFGAAARCVVSWGAVCRLGVLCLLAPCFRPFPTRCVCFAVVCRCVVLFAVVLCAVCALGCRVVCFLSSPPCAVLLCGPLSLGALLPCAVPRHAALPRGAVVSCPAALLGLFLAPVWLYLLESIYGLSSY